MSQHVDRVGQQVGNYRLERLLGRGGFAEVYLGRQVFLESPAAIKLLHANLAQAESEGFRAEAVTLVRLIHPHIVRILDFGVEGTTPFLVMEYAPHPRRRLRQADRRGAAVRARSKHHPPRYQTGEYAGWATAGDRAQ